MPGRWIGRMAGLGLLLAVTAWPVAAPAAAQGNPPAPSVTIFFEQDYLRAEEPLRATVSLANPTAQAFSANQLSIAGPDFILWHADTCAGALLGPKATLDLGSIQAYGVGQPKTLCATLGNNPRFGTFNVQFSVQYNWKATNAANQGLVTSVKQIKTDLFGADNLLGVPLAFAGLLLPGIAFWTVLRLFKVSWSQGWTSQDSVFLGIVVSLLFIWLALGAARLWPAAAWPGYFNISNNISVTRLVWLTAAGVALGVIVGGLYTFWLKWKQGRQQEELAQQQALALKPNDQPIDLVRKILKLNGAYDGRPVIVRLNGEKGEFRGAHAAKLPQVCYLVGSFRLVRQLLPPRVQAEVEKHCDGPVLRQKPEELLQVLELVKDVRGAVVLLGPVETYEKGQWQEAGSSYPYLLWNSPDVGAILPDWTREDSLLVME